MRRRRDDGFTLLELMVTISIATVLMSIGILTMRSYLLSSREAGTAADVRSALRAAAEQSLSEGRTYCVKFTATTWATYLHDCTVGSNKVQGPNTVDDPSLTLAPSFPAPASPIPNQTTACTPAASCAYFYPRGTALSGSIAITRANGKTYTISVEGLTSRVSTS